MYFMWACRIVWYNLGNILINLCAQCMYFCALFFVQVGAQGHKLRRIKSLPLWLTETDYAINTETAVFD